MPARAGRTCLSSDQGQLLDDTARRKLGKHSNGETSWQMCRSWKEAGTLLLNSKVLNSSPTLEPGCPEERDTNPGPAGL